MIRSSTTLRHCNDISELNERMRWGSQVYIGNREKLIYEKTVWPHEKFIPIYHYVIEKWTVSIKSKDSNHSPQPDVFSKITMGQMLLYILIIRTNTPKPNQKSKQVFGSQHAVDGGDIRNILLHSSYAFECFCLISAREQKCNPCHQSIGNQWCMISDTMVAFKIKSTKMKTSIDIIYLVVCDNHICSYYKQQVTLIWEMNNSFVEKTTNTLTFIVHWFCKSKKSTIPSTYTYPLTTKKSFWMSGNFLHLSTSLTCDVV